MNKQIETLWAQAMEEVPGTPDNVPTLERFAELLVRECAHIAQNEDAIHAELQAGRTFAAGKILEHFQLK